ncbi:hypothetical protein M3Y98_00301100 [Aphelenchoides besseyi]|nr:hypothetical protein M3Y98_00301100 [Aphelenchoides besseyi]KAI6201230.1 hypothetical protein M3Y96_00819500 [Aphelenchoides besseyi]
MTAAATLHSFLMVYCFPVQFTIGVIGNTVNLVVLLNKRMRSKTNFLLAGMALADILFLVFMMPNTLIYYPKLLEWEGLQFMNAKGFKGFYVYASYYSAGIINMLTFISAWIIVLVSFERMTAVLFPLKARLFWNYRTLRICIGCILIASIIISMHFYITHGLKVFVYSEPFRNSTVNTTVERRTLKNIVRPGMESLWQIMTIIDTVVIVFLPIILVIITNMAMICSLQKQKLPLALKNAAHRSSSETQTDTLHHNTSVYYSSSQSRNQRQATFIVFLIALTFTICNVPSALTHIFEIIWAKNVSEEFITVVTLTNSLVVTSKTMNLFLFCMWSAHFRKNLCRIIRSKLETAFVCSTKNQGCRTETDNSWKGRPKLRRSYNQTALVPATSKRSLPFLKRDPSTRLETRHSLPASVNSHENEIGNVMSEKDELMKWNF